MEKRPKGHVLVEGETAVDKVKRDADLLAAEDEEEEDDAEVGAPSETAGVWCSHPSLTWSAQLLLSWTFEHSIVVHPLGRGANCTMLRPRCRWVPWGCHQVRICRCLAAV